MAQNEVRMSETSKCVYLVIVRYMRLIIWYMPLICNCVHLKGFERQQSGVLKGIFIMATPGSILGNLIFYHDDIGKLAAPNRAKDSSTK